MASSKINIVTFAGFLIVLSNPGLLEAQNNLIQAYGLPANTVPNSVRVSDAGPKGNFNTGSYESANYQSGSYGGGQYRVAALPTTNKKAEASKTAAKGKAKKEVPPSYDLDFSIYRDRETYPIDPRKPCHNCVRPDATYPTTRFDIPALRGRPHKDYEPGGCTCGKPRSKHAHNHPLSYVHWPRPLNARMAERYPQASMMRLAAQPVFQLNSRFDHLENFKLFNYKRTDNGYCGEDSDPYGCLGESKQRELVYGLGFRSPGTPVAPAMGGAYPMGN